MKKPSDEEIIESAKIFGSIACYLQGKYEEQEKQGKYLMDPKELEGYINVVKGIASSLSWAGGFEQANEVIKPFNKMRMQFQSMFDQAKAEYYEQKRKESGDGDAT